MNIDYDIFEILPDGSAMWRMCVRGLQSTTEALTGISKQASNECFAIELNTQSIIGWPLRWTQLFDVASILLKIQLPRHQRN